MGGKKKYIKGFLEDIVLKMISDNREMYGYEITKEVSKLTDGSIKITEGALYPVLHRLENSGLLKSHIREVKGRPRKYYQISEVGGKEVSETMSELKNFIEALQGVLKLKPEQI